MRTDQLWHILVLTLALGLGVSLPALAQCTELSPPSNVAPFNGATEVELTPTLEILSLTVGLCEVNETQWQVATNPGFSSLVFDSGFSTSALQEITLSPGLLEGAVTYFWRARMKAVQEAPFGDVVSDWSATSTFTTSTLSVGCDWGAVIPVSPPDGATNVSARPTLVISRGVPFPPACPHDASDWQIANSPDFSTGSIVADSVRDSVNLTSFTPTITLEESTTYYWRARMKSFDEQVSDWSPGQRFTTEALLGSCMWGTVVNAEPEDGEVVLTATPTLWINRILPPANACINTISDWQVATNPSFSGNSVVFQTLNDSVNRTVLGVPAGRLVDGVIYYWRARMKDNAGSDSGWTVPTRFTVILSGASCNWGVVVNISPEEGEGGVALDPTLRILYTPPPTPACGHDATDWQMSTVPNFGTLSASSENDTANLTTIKLPPGFLDPNTTYYWRARFQSAGGTTSNWSTTTSFRTTTSGGGSRPPEANFTFNPVSPRLGQPVQFTDLSTSPDGPNDIVIWRWDFGDGNTSDLPNPVHTFAAVATFNVRLTVTDRDGNLGSAIKAVTVLQGGGGATIDQAIASLIPNDPPNSPTPDNVIGDREILEAIRLWVLGEPVPGTNGKVIDDVEILNLISKWVLGTFIPLEPFVP